MLNYRDTSKCNAVRHNTTANYDLDAVTYNLITTSMTDFMAVQVYWIALDCTGVSNKVVTECCILVVIMVFCVFVGSRRLKNGL